MPCDLSDLKQKIPSEKFMDSVTRFIMDTRILLYRVLALLFLQHAVRGQNVIQSKWRRVFTVDVAITADRVSVLAVTSKYACGGVCERDSSCKAFAFQSSSSSCSLYSRIMEYTLTGDPANRTSYYWPQGQRCPSELGYVLDNGLCFKVSASKSGWYPAQAVCRGDGGHLFVGDTQEKVTTLLAHTVSVGKAWLGAHDLTGEWRWVDGSLLPLNFPAWAGGQPSGGTQHWVGMTTAGRFDDVASGVPDYYVCQMPL